MIVVLIKVVDWWHRSKKSTSHEWAVCFRTHFCDSDDVIQYWKTTNRFFLLQARNRSRRLDYSDSGRQERQNHFTRANPENPSIFRSRRCDVSDTPTTAMISNQNHADHCVHSFTVFARRALGPSSKEARKPSTVLLSFIRGHIMNDMPSSPPRD